MITTLIVDDEAPARAKLRTLLAASPDFEVVGEADDGLDAVDQIRALAPTVVFLDIQMPQLDGFEVVATIGPEQMPIVVFATAYDQHALAAFEVEALDYLVKPFAPNRFRSVLERVRRRVAERDPDRAIRLDRLLQDRLQGRPLLRLRVRADAEREVILALEDVDLIRAQRNDLHFIGPRGEFWRRGTLVELETQLDPDAFLRVNRSDVVRLDAIAEITPWFHGDAKIRLRDGRIVSWSRRYRLARPL